MLANQRVVRRLAGAFGLLRFTGFAANLEKLFSSCRRYGARKRTIIEILLISFSFQFLMIFTIFILALALGISIPFYYFGAFVGGLVLLVRSVAKSKES